jgi:hypothetical protein
MGLLGMKGVASPGRTLRPGGPARPKRIERGRPHTGRPTAPRTRTLTVPLGLLALLGAALVGMLLFKSTEPSPPTVAAPQMPAPGLPHLPNVAAPHVRAPQISVPTVPIPTPTLPRPDTSRMGLPSIGWPGIHDDKPNAPVGTTTPRTSIEWPRLFLTMAALVLTIVLVPGWWVVAGRRNRVIVCARSDDRDAVRGALRVVPHVRRWTPVLLVDDAQRGIRGPRLSGRADRLHADKPRPYQVGPNESPLTSGVRSALTSTVPARAHVVVARPVDAHALADLRRVAWNVHVCPRPRAAQRT